MVIDKQKPMTAAQICRMLDNQSAIWNALYRDTKAQDAALVASVIDDLLASLRAGTDLSGACHCGSVACHGSDALRRHLFPKKVGANG